MGKLSGVFELQFPHPYDGNNNSSFALETLSLPSRIYSLASENALLHTLKVTWFLYLSGQLPPSHCWAG